MGTQVVRYVMCPSVRIGRIRYPRSMRFTDGIRPRKMAAVVSSPKRLSTLLFRQTLPSTHKYQVYSVGSPCVSRAISVLASPYICMPLSHYNLEARRW